MWLRHTTANENGPNESAANAYFQSSPVNVSWKGFENQYFIGDGGSDTKKSVLKHFERYYGYAPESGNR
jgi:hypothetical protein